MKRIGIIIGAILISGSITNFILAGDEPLKPKNVPQNAVWLKEDNEWKCNISDDETQTWREDGSVSSIIVRDDSSSDWKCTSFYKSGKIQQVILRFTPQGDGDATSWWENGKMKSRGKYLNGHLIGLWEFFDENGVLINKDTFTDDGTLISRYMPGDPEKPATVPAKAIWIKELKAWGVTLEDKEIYWYETGELCYKGTTGQKGRTGEWTHYRKDGTVDWVNNFVDDKLDGISKFYNEKSQLIREEIYENGKLVSKKEYDPK